jgi:hypothetical protein
MGSSCRYKSFLYFLSCYSLPSTKYFFSSPVTILLHLSPLPGQARQALVLGHLSLNKCLCSHLIVVVMMNVSRRLSEKLANVSVPVEQPASRVGTETGLVWVQRDWVRAATERAFITLSRKALGPIGPSVFKG